MRERRADVVPTGEAAERAARLRGGADPDATGSFIGSSFASMAARASAQDAFMVPSTKLVALRFGLTLRDDGNEGAEAINAIEGQTTFASAASGSVSPPALAGP